MSQNSLVFLYIIVCRLFSKSTSITYRNSFWRQSYRSVYWGLTVLQWTVPVILRFTSRLIVRKYICNTNTNWNQAFCLWSTRCQFQLFSKKHIAKYYKPQGLMGFMTSLLSLMTRGSQQFLKFVSLQLKVLVTCYHK